MVATYPVNGLLGMLEEKRYNRQRRDLFVNGLRADVNKRKNRVEAKKINITIKNQDRWR